MTYAKRLLGAATIGILMAGSPFLLGAFFGDNSASPVIHALSETLFTIGLSVIFGCAFAALFRKRSLQLKSALGCLGFPTGLFLLSIMNKQQEIPAVFSPALLAYPALGLVFMCVFMPLAEVHTDH